MPSDGTTRGARGPRVRRVARRLAEVVCPPGSRGTAADRQVLAEFGLMLGALAPAARKALTPRCSLLDQGARLSAAAGTAGLSGW